MEYNMSEIAMACVSSGKSVASWKQMGVRYVGRCECVLSGGVLGWGSRSGGDFGSIFFLRFFSLIVLDSLA